MAVNRRLYVGDLSTVCTELDLFREFSRFGIVDEVRIHRNNTTSTMDYGFVKMCTPMEAYKALIGLDGYMLCGRNLKVQFAENGLRGTQKIEKYSVHFKFSGMVAGSTTDEVTLREVFSHYGEVIDISLRRKFVDEGGFQRGYGFVKFFNEQQAHNLIYKCPSILFGHFNYVLEPSGGSTKCNYSAPAKPMPPHFANNHLYSHKLSSTQYAVPYERPISQPRLAAQYPMTAPLSCGNSQYGVDDYAVNSDHISRYIYGNQGKHDDYISHHVHQSVHNFDLRSLTAPPNLFSFLEANDV